MPSLFISPWKAMRRLMAIEMGLYSMAIEAVLTQEL